MIKNNHLNALNLFEMRRFEVPPAHFEHICIPLKYNLEESLSKWIEDNLKGRYYLGKTLSLGDDNQTVFLIKIAFEEAKELSYFTLACPHLKYT